MLVPTAGPEFHNPVMRRFLSWHLPLSIGVLATVVFAWGLYTGLRGDAGSPVLDSRPRRAARPDDRGRLDILLLGDSLARGMGDASGKGIGGHLLDELTAKKVTTAPPVNIAIAGAQTGDLLEQMESNNVRELIGQANLIVVSIGGNDLHGETRDRPPSNPALAMSQTLDRVEGAIRSVREINQTARIFVIGLYNPFVGSEEGKSLNAVIQRWNGEMRVRFADDANLAVVETSDVVDRPERLSVDRFHPNSQSYAIIARRIVDAM